METIRSSGCDNRARVSMVGRAIPFSASYLRTSVVNTRYSPPPTAGVQHVWHFASFIFRNDDGVPVASASAPPRSATPPATASARSSLKKNEIMRRGLITLGPDTFQTRRDALPRRIRCCHLRVSMRRRRGIAIPTQ